MKTIKLFCLPHAGGSGAIYNEWRKYISPAIDLLPIEYAGRGKRFSEDCYSSVEVAVNDIFDNIKYKLGNSQYALFGHSLGGLLAYELARKIKKATNEEPVVVFISGTGAPHVKDDKITHLMPDDEFINEINKMGGIPQEIIAHREFLNIFVPILKADIRISENYKFDDKYESNKLNCDIIVFTGKDDSDVQYSDAMQWKEYTNKYYSMYSFEGGHFFINDDKNLMNISRIINNYLTSKSC